MRSNYLVLKLSNKISQQRTTILFEEYPDIPITYDLYHTMQMIFSKDTFNELKHTKFLFLEIEKSIFQKEEFFLILP